MFGVLFPLSFVKADYTYTQCMADRQAIINKSYDNPNFWPSDVPTTRPPYWKPWEDFMLQSPQYIAYLAADKKYNDALKSSQLQQDAANKTKEAECNKLPGSPTYKAPVPVSTTPIVQDSLVTAVPPVQPIINLSCPTPITPPAPAPIVQTITLADPNTAIYKKEIEDLKNQNVGLVGQINDIQNKLDTANEQIATLKKLPVPAKTAPMKIVLPVEIPVVVAPVVTTSQVQTPTPVPVKQGFWQRVTGWFR